MLEFAESGAKVSKAEYEAAIPQLRVDLINAQYDLQAANFSVLVTLIGDDRQGIEEVVDLLHEWMDGRYIGTHFFGESHDSVIKLS